MLMICYPIEKLRPGMAILLVGDTGSRKFVGREGDRILLYDELRDFERHYSYASDYNYSIVTLEEAIELEDDELRVLALRILRGDPMALDAARDVLKGGF